MLPHMEWLGGLIEAVARAMMRDWTPRLTGGNDVRSGAVDRGSGCGCSAFGTRLSGGLKIAKAGSQVCYITGHPQGVALT